MVETKGKKTHGTKISMSRAPLRLLSIVYKLIHESVNRAENFTFGYRGRIGLSVWALDACVQAIDVKNVYKIL